MDEQAGFHDQVQRIILELKILHQSLDETIAQGLKQTADYADLCAADEAHLLIFNRQPDVAWDDKIWQDSRPYAQRSISLWGL